MHIIGKTVWQQAAGDTDRDYADLCIRWDVILNGPGYAGPWPGCAQELREEGFSSRKMTDLGRFCDNIKDDDIIVLRQGTGTVVAVGNVVGGYEWKDEFGDIDGWSLQHVRRVRWLLNLSQEPKRFDAYSLKWGDTTQLLNHGLVTEWLSSLEIPIEAFDRVLIALPDLGSCAETSIQQLSEHLFDYGVASSSISNLLNEIGELVRIAKWYQRSLNKPSEHETVAYLVAPLLRGLGWTPQRMAIEWNCVDLALFEFLPRSDDSLMVVVEVKKMSASCLTALSQAQSYAKEKTGCHRLIVTDGLRYGVYVRKSGDEFNLYAYMNLTDLRAQYPVYECGGARDALLAMSPEWKATT